MNPLLEKRFPRIVYHYFPQLAIRFLKFFSFCIELRRFYLKHINLWHKKAKLLPKHSIYHAKKRYIAIQWISFYGLRHRQKFLQQRLDFAIQTIYTHTIHSYAILKSPITAAKNEGSDQRPPLKHNERSPSSGHGVKMKEIMRFDFGNNSVRADDGFLKLERLYKSPHFMWMTELKNRWHTEAEHSPFRDYVFASKSELRMALPAGDYRLRLHFFDPTEKHAPFTVKVCHLTSETPIFEGEIDLVTEIDISQGKKVSVDIPISHKCGDVAVDFFGIGNGNFFINGLDILAEKEIRFGKLFVDSPEDTLPSKTEVLSRGTLDPEKALSSCCEWLMAHRTADGFLGDYEMNKRLWYTSSYPLRTLLAGYDLLGKEEYYAAAKTIFDRFVEEQMPEGSFTQAYRGAPTNKLTEEELEKVRHGNWMNLADIGSMVAALSVMCGYTKNPVEKEKYTGAVRRYLDGWAMRFRRENGGFDNGWVHRPAEKVYSVSTASTALSMLLIGQAANTEVYKTTAEDAVSLLADRWNENGENWNFIFDGTYPGHDHYQNVLEFGFGFYTLEAFSAALALSENPDLRAKLFEALKRYLFGSAGILRFLDDASWWPLQNVWNNSKSAGNPILLQDFLEYGAQFGASEEEMARCRHLYEQCGKFLCTPEFSAQIGVMAEDPKEGVPFRIHSIQSWTGCAVAATGFAGIAYANMIKPGILYLKKDRT